MSWRIVGTLKRASRTVLDFFVIANILYWAIPAFTAISSLFQNQSPIASSRIVYKSFVEWRGSEIKTADFNVGGPLMQRRTVNDNTEGSRKVYFFGGSTMWGAGSNDVQTIPSQFAAATRIHSENFAVPGYIAHQSLVNLIQLLQDGHRPDLVVFYDGINDVWAKCRREHDAHSHMWERDYRAILSDSKPDTFSHYLRAVVRLVERINNEISQSLGEGVYDCASDPAKAEAIAENLVRDWQFASRLAKLFDAKFIGLFQPVSYLTGSAATRFKASRNLEPQFTAVYPLIRKKIAAGGEIHDLVSLFDPDESVYLDFAHVNAVGNGYVAKKIVELAAPLGFGG
ncbi:MAG: hypothetical protein QOG83_3345 [Alphaproteobacteria bacterium]|jgi:lysophospholipase L1-like esterase|nr:hypothetical protein [Alphaproteobacteria bacterium]MEA2990634.1 hypothetical protein [Alphaproteobacteria bacterium]